MEYLDIVKAIKKKPIAKQLTDDEILDSVKEVEQVIKNYCQIPKVPDSLFYVLVNMTVDLITYQQKQDPANDIPADEIDMNDVSAIHIGDTSITLGNKSKNSQSHVSNLDEIVFNYKAQLNEKRRIW